MIAANPEPGKITARLRYLIRTGAITDYISKIDDAVELRRRVEARLQSFEIGMYVANN